MSQDSKSDPELLGRIIMLEQQRNAALNQCVVLSGQLARVADELEQAKKADEPLA